MMESQGPSSTDRRQAWVQSSRRRITQEDAESGSTCPGSLSLQDDVFSDGCSTGKIETWLQGCGSEPGPENSAQPTIETLLKTCSSFEDDLTLGAEATELHAAPARSELRDCPLLLPPPKSRRKDFNTSAPGQKLNLPLFNMGYSMASSALSSTTSKTASSVSDVLQMCAEDAEETLYQLGFGCEEQQMTARIPSRFFTFPSELRGINFRLFLESQLRRLRQEDPGLSLASRFRQVEVLTAMANAFYSLYSHVSRTPLQKLAPPELSPSPAVERSVGPRFFSRVRSEPRSPVERLKDTVSKMCLYAGARASESASPTNASPRRGGVLPDVTDTAKDKASSDAEAWERHVKQAEDFSGEEEDCRMDAEMDCKGEVDRGGMTDRVGMVHPATQAKMDRTQCLRASLSGPRESFRVKTSLFRSDVVSQDGITENRCSDIVRLEDYASLTTHNPSVPIEPVPKVSYDVICPQVVELVHQSPYCLPQMNSTSAANPLEKDQCYGGSSSSSVTQPEPRQIPSQTDAVPTLPSTVPVDRQEPCPDELDNVTCLSSTTHVCLSPPETLMTPRSPCRITVTGWEGDVTSPFRDSLEDDSSPSCMGTRPSQKLPRSHSEGIQSQRYLSPNKQPLACQHCQPPKQANSFELEEVHSAEEEEEEAGGSLELRNSATLSLSSPHQIKGLPLRGDSYQSDSSGYAEEDVHLSPHH